MSPEDNSLESDFDEASARLSEGLKSCRSVVQNYRMMLNGENATLTEQEADFTDSAANDQ